jgi:hypothetical protein
MINQIYSWLYCTLFLYHFQYHVSQTYKLLFHHKKRCHLETIEGITSFISVSFHTFLSMDDIGLLLPGWAWSDDRTSGERAKRESSSRPNKCLAARLSATTRTCATICGCTRERGDLASVRTLKYAWAISASKTAL